MKKILLIVLAVLVAAGLVTFMVIKQQSGYTKVMTAKIARQDLSTVISGTGQIKPKTYAVIGSTAQGRITHLYAREGDRVKQGEVLAVVENVGQEAQVTGQEAAIASAKRSSETIPSGMPSEATKSACQETPRPCPSRGSSCPARAIVTVLAAVSTTA